MTTKKKLHVEPTELPALRAFLLGYLHEDYIVDHGSVEKALEAFRDDASEEDVRELAANAVRFLEKTEGLSIRKLRDLLADGFGCAWEPADRDEVERLFRSIG